MDRVLYLHYESVWIQRTLFGDDLQWYIDLFYIMFGIFCFCVTIVGYQWPELPIAAPLHLYIVNFGLLQCVLCFAWNFIMGDLTPLAKPNNKPSFNWESQNLHEAFNSFVTGHLANFFHVKTEILGMINLKSN